MLSNNTNQIIYNDNVHLFFCFFQSIPLNFSKNKQEPSPLLQTLIKTYLRISISNFALKQTMKWSSNILICSIYFRTSASSINVTTLVAGTNAGLMTCRIASHSRLPISPNSTNHWCDAGSNR